MKTLTIGQTSYPLPSSFSEIPENLLSDVLTNRIIYNYTQNHNTDLAYSYRIALAKLLVPMPVATYVQLTAGQLAFLSSAFNWIYTTQITKRPVSSFQIETEEYFVFAEDLADTSAIELAMTMIYLDAYARSEGQNKQAFSMLLANLCRKKRKDLDKFKKSSDWNGDVRQPYNSTIAEETAAVFEQKIPIGIAFILFQYLEFSIQKFLKRYERLFQEDDTIKDPIFGNGRGWLSMLEDVAETTVHGNINQVYTQNVHSVFMFLEHKKVKVEQIEAAQQTQNQDE